MVHAWDQFLTERDRLVFEKAGYGRRAGYGKRPALFIIDVAYNFIGDRPEAILESIKRWRQSSGEEGWAALRHIQPLLAAARSQRIPIVYTYSDARPDYVDVGVRHLKNYRRVELIFPSL